MKAVLLSDRRTRCKTNMGTVMAVCHLLSAFGERAPALALWESMEKGVREARRQCPSSEVLEGSPGLQAFLGLLPSFLALILLPLGSSSRESSADSLLSSLNPIM